MRVPDESSKLLREAVSTGDSAADPPSALPSFRENAEYQFHGTVSSAARQASFYLDNMLLGNLLPHGAFHLLKYISPPFLSACTSQSMNPKGARTPGSQGSPRTHRAAPPAVTTLLRGPCLSKETAW